MNWFLSVFIGRSIGPCPDWPAFWTVLLLLYPTRYRSGSAQTVQCHGKSHRIQLKISSTRPNLFKRGLIFFRISSKVSSVDGIYEVCFCFLWVVDLLRSLWFCAWKIVNATLNKCAVLICDLVWISFVD